MTFYIRQPFMEGHLRRKTTCGGKCHLMKALLRWKTTLEGRQPCMENNLQWKKN